MVADDRICRDCGGRMRKRRESKFRDEYGNADSVDIYECEDCGAEDWGD